MVPPLFEPSGHFPVTDTYAGSSIIPATIAGGLLGKEGGREVSFPPSGLRVIMRS